MKGLGRRVLACCLTVPLVLSNQVMGYAEETEVSAVGDYSMTVNAYRASDFLVSIPKSADLSTGTSQYKVKVKGNIAANDSVIVEPDNSFIMTSDSGQAAVASVTQSKTEWQASELTSDNFVEATGDISCNIDVGTWTGQLHFNIKKGAGTGDSSDVGDYGIQDMYFGNAVITVKDGDTLYVDGVQVTLTDNSYTITDKGTHKVIIISSSGSGVIKDIVIAESNIAGVSSVKKPNGDYELSFTPDSGKIVESVIVNGNTVDVTANADGSYSFVISSSTDLSNITININVKYDMPDASPDDYFTFELNSEGTGYSITDITSTGKQQRVLSFPSEYQGLPVVTLGKTGGRRLLYSRDTEVRELYIPDSVTTIEYCAFENSCISKVVMTDSVKRIGSDAFKECTGLTELHLSGTEISIGRGAFGYCNGLKDISLNYSEHITLGIGSFNIARYDAYHQSSTSISIGDLNSDATFKFSTPIIDADTPFGADAHIVRYEIPSSVVKLGGLLSSSTLTDDEIHIPSTVTSLEDNAFSGCDNLTSISIPDSVTSLGNSVFSGCDNLTSISIPDSVTSLGNSVFKQCTSLISVDLPDGITVLGDMFFEKCTSLSNLDVLSVNNITSVGDYAFQGCTGLVNIVIPDSVSTIGKYVFRDCTSLRSLILPKDLTKIPEGLVRDCSALKYIYIYGNPEFNKHDISKYVSGTGLVVDKTRAPFYGAHYGSFPDSSCTLYFELSDNTTFTGLDSYDQIAISNSERANTEYGVTLEQFKTAAGL